MLRQLLPLIPSHHTYVEVFGGGAALLFNKEPSPVEVYNDINGDLVNFFRVLRDPQKFQELYRRLLLTPYSREEYHYCARTYEKTTDDTERAYKFYVWIRMGINGTGAVNQRNSWSYSVRTSTGGISATTYRWLGALQKLPEFHARIMTVQIENDDFRKIIPRYDTPETLFYCDPPYVPETRGPRTYKFSMSADDHKELVNLLLSVQGMALLSGYRHPIYEPLEKAGWVRKDFSAKLSIARRYGLAVPRVESVWINPRAWERLEVAKIDSIFTGRLEPVEPLATPRGGNVVNIIIEDRR